MSSLAKQVHEEICLFRNDLALYLPSVLRLSHCIAGLYYCQMQALEKAARLRDGDNMRSPLVSRVVDLF